MHYAKTFGHGENVLRPEVLFSHTFGAAQTDDNSTDTAQYCTQTVRCPADYTVKSNIIRLTQYIEQFPPPTLKLDDQLNCAANLIV
jgi:hypothetical protein